MQVTRKKAIEKLDREFSKYIRLVHSKDGMCECFTCGTVDHWKYMDCGHYMSRKHMLTRWDPENAKPQCKHCNQFKHGMPKEFRERLGDIADQLEADAKKLCKWDIEQLEYMLNIFKKLNKHLT